MEQGGIDIQKGLPGLPEGLAEPTEVVGIGGYVTAAVIVVLLVAILVGLGIWWAKRFGGRDPDGAGLPPKREAEEALRRLQSNLETLKTSQFALELSAVVRRCADRIWQTDLSHQTWHEHWSENGSGLAALPGKDGELLAQLLADCDALKFEPLEIPPSQKSNLLSRASDLIARFPARAGATQKAATRTHR